MENLKRKTFEGYGPPPASNFSFSTFQDSSFDDNQKEKEKENQKEKEKREKEKEKRAMLEGLHKCNICLETLVKTYILNPCGHDCCAACFEKLSEVCRKYEKPRCPMCRGDVAFVANAPQMVIQVLDEQKIKTKCSAETEYEEAAKYCKCADKKCVLVMDQTIISRVNPYNAIPWQSFPFYDTLDPAYQRMFCETWTCSGCCGVLVGAFIVCAPASCSLSNPSLSSANNNNNNQPIIQKICMACAGNHGSSVSKCVVYSVCPPSHDPSSLVALDCLFNTLEHFHQKENHYDKKALLAQKRNPSFSFSNSDQRTRTTNNFFDDSFETEENETEEKKEGKEKKGGEIKILDFDEFYQNILEYRYACRILHPLCPMVAFEWLKKISERVAKNVTHYYSTFISPSLEGLFGLHSNNNNAQNGPFSIPSRQQSNTSRHMPLGYGGPPLGGPLSSSYAGGAMTIAEMAIQLLGHEPDSESENDNYDDGEIFPSPVEMSRLFLPPSPIPSFYRGSRLELQIDIDPSLDDSVVFGGIRPSQTPSRANENGRTAQNAQNAQNGERMEMETTNESDSENVYVSERYQNFFHLSEEIRELIRHEQQHQLLHQNQPQPQQQPQQPQPQQPQQEQENPENDANFSMNF